ncbi:unnamed protein product [Allacma fusca]|uniref:Uncharacterized protein n=1 Tax=Allacma fusca TaxID=39272 RepID=A0A8J2KRE4_9HEXA|nr:unnamed protein product [Allacma fusca]
MRRERQRKAQEQALFWVTSDNFHIRERFELIIIFRQDSTSSEFLARLIETTSLYLRGALSFVIFPKNVTTENAFSNHHSISNDSQISNAVDCFSGYFYFYGIPPVTYGFDCKVSECHKTMISTFEIATHHGKNVAWEFIMPPDDLQEKSGLNSGSPFQRKNPSNLINTTYAFFCLDFYSNLTYDVFDGEMNPIIVMDLAHFDGKFKVGYLQEYPVSVTIPKIFITSDNINAVTLEFKIYTSPFDTKCWIGIASVIVLIALVLSSKFFSPGHNHFVKKFPWVLLSAMESLIDQGMTIPKRGAKISDFIQSKSRRTAYTLPGGDIFWTTCYTCNKTSKNCLRECTLMSSIGLFEVYFKCSNHKEQMEINEHSSKTIVPNQFHPFCEEDLRSIIATNLTFPRTALVLPSIEFEYYWDQATSIYVASYFDEEHHHVAKRAQIMLSSGLYLMWEKWGQIRFPECHSDYRSRVSHGSSVRALSMESSLVLALYAFLWGLLGCTFCFIVETLYCIGSRCVL